MRNIAGVGSFTAALLTLFASPGSAQFDVQGPIQVNIVGDTLADEGDRVAYTLVPWTTHVASVFQWDFGDGSPVVTRETETALGHRFMQDGEYTIGATDGAGVTSLSVTIRPVRPTIAVLSASEPARIVPSVHFQAVAYDPGRDTLTYAWDFGDGSPVERGVDLVDPRHTYSAPGSYEVTLTVTDEDGLDAVRTLRIDVNPGFLGQLTGEIERPVEGVAGEASLWNALGVTPVLTGSAPMGSGVADLSDETGVCIVNAGFWDDEREVHVNFQWTADSERMFEPGTYQVGWRQPEGGDRLAKNQVIVNVLVLEIDPTYEDTKRGAQEHQVFEDGYSLLSSVRDVFSAFMNQANSGPMGPGTNWQLTSLNRPGQLTITRVTRRRIYGQVDVQLMGGWTNRDGSGSTESVSLEGAFAWDLDEVAQANIERCAERPFRISSHTPEVEDMAVDYEVPQVSVTFSLPVERESVTADALELGYLDSSDQLHPIDTRIVFDEDPRKVWLVPEAPLDDAVYHKVRVRGGEAGVLSLMGDELERDYEWRFATMPELVKRPEETQ